jgi:DNA-binding CsgD family transcriptional regulator
MATKDGIGFMSVHYDDQRLHKPPVGWNLLRIHMGDDAETYTYAIHDAIDVQIMALVAEGLTNHQIASKAYLSEKTVKNRLTKIYRRLGVASRTQAVMTLNQPRSIPVFAESEQADVTGITRSV